MPRFDRYILGQLIALFGFFALVLVGVYWINSAVKLFDQLIGNGQTALAFLEFSVLALPNVIKLVLPVAAFVATVYGVNRLTSDSELVVMQATGFSPLRMARPVLVFGLIVAGMMLVLANLLVPAARQMADTQRAEMSENITARFLQEGQFLHPSPGVTLYIREISAEGALLDLFLYDDRPANTRTTYTAGRALFVKGDNGPKLIMFDGMAQVLNRSSQRLSTTRFADFTYDLGALLTKSGTAKRNADQLATSDLLWPTAAIATETGETPGALVYDGHARFGDAFLGLAAALIGFASLMQGGYSRLGLWRQILGSVALLVLVQAIATAAAARGPKLPGGFVLAYAAPGFGIVLALAMLVWAGRSRRMGTAA